MSNTKESSSFANAEKATKVANARTRLTGIYHTTIPEVVCGIKFWTVTSKFGK
jgi:hypothetical protein